MHCKNIPKGFRYVDRLRSRLREVVPELAGLEFDRADASLRPLSDVSKMFCLEIVIRNWRASHYKDDDIWPTMQFDGPSSVGSLVIGWRKDELIGHEPSQSIRLDGGAWDVKGFHQDVGCTMVRQCSLVLLWSRHQQEVRMSRTRLVHSPVPRRPFRYKPFAT